MATRGVDHLRLVIVLLDDGVVCMAENGACEFCGFRFVADQRGHGRITEPVRRDSDTEFLFGALVDRNTQGALRQSCAIARNPQGVGWLIGRFG